MLKLIDIKKYFSLFVIMLIPFLLVGLVFGLILYQDYREGECYKYVDTYIKDRSSMHLQYISDEERKSLSIEEGLIPSQRYYEQRKCMTYGKK